MVFARLAVFTASAILFSILSMRDANNLLRRLIWKKNREKARPLYLRLKNCETLIFEGPFATPKKGSSVI